MPCCAKIDFSQMITSLEVSVGNLATSKYLE